MDAKALAKSKRAHYQHHSKKTHPSQKPKPPSTSANDAANTKKQSGKQIREEIHQAKRVSALPSNRDRYEEEFDSGSEDPYSDSASHAPEIIGPKSKGADFCNLIAEAQSQLPSNSNSDSLPSLDDFLPGDFNQFLGSILAVRGEGILSWIGTDNFVVEDITTETPEASFLSLNLRTLGNELEKVDLSVRLFIEEDILPPKLRPERSTLNRNLEPDQMQMTSDKESASKITEETLNDFAEKFNLADTSVEHMSLSSGSRAMDATLSNGEESYTGFISNQHVKSGQSRARNNSNSASVSNINVSTFEAIAAEAELDMLLNSFSETQLLETSGFNAVKPSSNFHREDSSSLPQFAGEGAQSSKSAAVNSSLDGLLDLLQETSTRVNQGVNPSDSAAANSTIDDLLDDLLQETSTMVNQNGLSERADVNAAQGNNMQSSSSSSSSYSQSMLKSDILNDFDSW